MAPTILVVDDEVYILHILDFILGAESYEVLTASNGEQALQKVREEKPDLVILAFFTLFAITVLILVFVLIFFFFLLFLFFLGISSLLVLSVGLGGGVLWVLLQLVDLDQGVGLRPSFRHSGCQQGQIGDWEASAQLVGGWEVIQVVGHVDLSESGASEVIELLVIAMQDFVLGLHQISHVRELNSLLVDSNILQEVPQVAPSGFVDVSEHSILEGNVIFLL